MKKTFLDLDEKNNLFNKENFLLSFSILKLVLLKIDHYPNFNLPKIYHGCGVRKKCNGFNELIDQANDERCSSLTHVAYWKFRDTKKHKVSNKRYLTRSFLKELTEKGLLITYKPIYFTS